MVEQDAVIKKKLFQKEIFSNMGKCFAYNIKRKDSG